jgi:(5-formylfuran-3-yl)methyl phosphate transaminase
LIARRAEEIAPFMVMEVLERAREMERQGIDVVHLEVGEPDFDIPASVKAAVCAALDEGGRHIILIARVTSLYGRRFASII